ncbi:MAG TPA: pyridoxamine 5'-phosphate oxidase family protein [Burkholderiales bacterium]|nr:pyridoxamine 5'-phosphate oxidase family protein [Burkholderiales bacterium]
MIGRRRFVRLAVLAAAAAATPAAFGVELPAATRAALESASLLYVATRRKSGRRSEAAPIWFMYEGDAVFFTTSPDSWKAKRIRRGSPLYIWVGSADGPFVVGEAKPVTDPAVVAHMGEVYAKKYWIAWLGLFRPRPDRVAAGKTLAYRVELSEGVPPPAPAAS